MRQMSIGAGGIEPFGRTHAVSALPCEPELETLVTADINATRVDTRAVNTSVNTS